jgi:hypothetical protein
MLALSELIDHASAVLPIDNQALLDIVSMVDKKVQPTKNAQAADRTAKHLLGSGATSVCSQCAACVLCKPRHRRLRSSPRDSVYTQCARSTAGFILRACLVGATQAAPS